MLLRINVAALAMQKNASVRLTQTVQKGGCAAKVAATELRKILLQVKMPPTPKELLVDASSFDDAAIYQLSNQMALVQTLDFFTPIVDTPKYFGRIAAANALSDVYAMGGKPITAMCIFAFPLMSLENQVAVDVLQGASEIVEESGAAVVGGHTIDDDTLKFGLSVTGLVHPKKMWTNAKAKVGDKLILTKALGTGTLTAALKRGEVSEEQIKDGIESMCKLNDINSVLDDSHREYIHAATDITGFGLAGHSYNLAKASGVKLKIEFAKLPRFERAMEFLDKGFLTKAHRTNFEYIKEHCEFANYQEHSKNLICDPQTSGGLLLSVDADFADEILLKLAKKFTHSQIIGEVATFQEKFLEII